MSLIKLWKYKMISYNVNFKILGYYLFEEMSVYYKTSKCREIRVVYLHLS